MEQSRRMTSQKDHSREQPLRDMQQVVTAYREDSVDLYFQQTMYSWLYHSVW